MLIAAGGARDEFRVAGRSQHVQQREGDRTSLPKAVSPAEWRAARIELLAEEQAITRVRDALNAKRRELPMVRIEKDYVFEGPEGHVGLLYLFDGRRQLIVGHFMFDPRGDEGCPSCSVGADEISNGLLEHLHARHQTGLRLPRSVSQARALPPAQGLDLPVVLLLRSDFNYDFHVTLDEWVAAVKYNYRTTTEHEQAGTSYYVGGEQPIEMPDSGYFLRDGDAVFHTYSTYARGAEMTGGSYYFLDLTALGRQEDWELPKGRATAAHRGRPDFAD
jgi:predicted dithiol-disulfide oxidoreductase (DUF899 family)